VTQILFLEGWTIIFLSSLVGKNEAGKGKNLSKACIESKSQFRNSGSTKNNNNLIFFPLKQCCGSRSESRSVGSVCFWATWIRNRIHKSEVWIRILLSPSKNSMKNLDSYCFVTFYLCKMMKMYLQKEISRKTFLKVVFCWHLEDQ
jgi:hypothetical protein